MFTSATMSLSMGLLNAVGHADELHRPALGPVGQLRSPSERYHLTVPGSDGVWIALAYSIVGTAITHFIGRPLIGINFRQQRLRGRTSGTT